MHQLTEVLRSLPWRRLSRTQAVWASLLVAMTGVGGLLMLLENRPALSGAGIPFVALTTPVADDTIQSVFETRPVVPGKWRGIVVHHSGSAFGSAETLTKEHNDRGFRGLGYHFVISNGQGAADGEVSIGYRWKDQLPGVHVVGPLAEQFNRETIGICLIGDGERRPFTDRQLASLARLVAFLSDGLEIPAQGVYLSRDVAPTSAPGRLFPEAAFREALSAGR